MLLGSRLLLFRQVTAVNERGLSSLSRVGITSQNHQMNIEELYNQMISSKKILPDRRQQSLMRGLAKLQKVLATYEPMNELRKRVAIEKRGPLGVLATPIHQAPTSQKMTVQQRQQPRGVYIWGGVGTGKSLLMDLFHRTAPLAGGGGGGGGGAGGSGARRRRRPRAARRVHFHAFMLEVHRRVHEWKQQDLARHGRRRHIDVGAARNPIVQVARQISRETHLLCFDEFQVTDIADAIIMKQLFLELFSNGTVLVATSNRPPRDLYKDGLNRHYFLPFIDILKHHCVVFAMDSSRDYRMLTSADSARGRFFLSASSSKAKEYVNTIYNVSEEEKTVVNVQFGRQLECPRVSGGACRFTFEELCARELGAADYAALGENFGALVLEGLPALTLKEHDRARRFITLVDELYERGTALVVLGAAAPLGDLLRGITKENNDEVVNGEKSAAEDLSTTATEGAIETPVDAAQELTVKEGEAAAVRELRFACARAASRLHEMCGPTTAD